MKLTVLTDNHTFIDQYYLGEPALCFLIETDGRKLLLDTGYSNVCLRNSQAMGIDLAQVDTIVLSHGHNDHTGGLVPLRDAGLLAGKTVLAHPLCIQPKRLDGQDIGCPFSARELAQSCNLHLSTEPVELTPHLTYLGEIPTTQAFEPRTSIGTYWDGSAWQPDLLLDDSALVYHTADGLYILTGCSHSGICNIIAYAKTLFPDRPVLGVIGGFHLFHCDQRLQDTISYFQAQNLQHLYPCHCVSFQAKAEMHRVIPVQETGVGLQLNW